MSLRISLSLCLTGKHEKKKQEATEVIQVRTHSLINLVNSLNTPYVKSLSEVPGIQQKPKIVAHDTRKLTF